MDGFAKGGEWKRALWQLEEAATCSVSGRGMADVISFNAAISACEAAAKWEEAFEVLKNLQLAICASDASDALQADVSLALVQGKILA